MTEAAVIDDAKGARLAGKYLTFTLAKESYGVPILKVKEIIQMTDSITAMPQTPDHIVGVTNLRGKVIPIVDLRALLQLAGGETAPRRCIVVTQVRVLPEKESLMGIIVDSVDEVRNISAAEIEETPDFGSDVNTDHILGMAKSEAAISALLDIDAVISSQTAAFADGAF